MLQFVNKLFNINNLVDIKGEIWRESRRRNTETCHSCWSRLIWHFKAETR